jgi:NitT/TauT family transport system ATP-binding protein
MTMPLLSLSNISLTFATRAAPALEGLHLDIFKGETLCLLGPSGCGKSTLLRLIAGLETGAGALAWAGEKPNIGFVFQEPNLMPWADVAANVAVPLRLAGQSRRDSGPPVEAALARVGLAGQGAALPRQLSGGMKMRVSLARALVDHPPVLLLDEPFAALDEITRWQLDDLVRSLREDGATVIFVTHSVFEAAYLADRIAVMRARPGRIHALVAVDQTGAARQASGVARRASPAYAQTCAALSESLREAMEPSPC